MLIGTSLQAFSAAHDGDAGHEHDAEYSQTAKGIVFNDLNRNGKRDPDEKGVAGIRVSNGREIVVTSDEGRYELPVSDDTIVFVIKPRHWATAINDDQIPQFFYIHKPKGSPPDFRFKGVEPTGDLPESIDLPLKIE